MSKQIVPLPYTPQHTIKVKPGEILGWEQNPRGLYHRVFKVESNAHMMLTGDISPMIIMVFTSFASGAAGAVMGALDHSTLLGWSTFILGTVFTAAPIIPWQIKRNRKGAKIREAIKLNLSEWVNKRYGLNTTEATFDDGAVVFLSGREKPGEYRVFQSDGRQFKLAFNDDRIYVEEYGNAPQADFTPVGSVAAITSEGNQNASGMTPLTGEAEALANGLLDTLGILLTRDLPTEHGHAVQRILDDLQKIIQYNNELAGFGGANREDSAAVTESLGDLAAEANDILAAEKATISRNLAVHQRYIKNRAADEPNPDLSLIQQAEEAGQAS